MTTTDHPMIPESNLPEKLHKSEVGFTNDQVGLIKRTVAKDATDDELALFLHQCKKTGLDPLAKQIYFQKRKNFKGESLMTIITAIDGYRLVAHRTGVYAGLDPTVFDNEDSPKKATVTVYKIVAGLRCPFTATARWDQYYPGDKAGFMWVKMPHLMLEKCAEALALRKAFPSELSGVYTAEEMQQADSTHKPSAMISDEKLYLNVPQVQGEAAQADVDQKLESSFKEQVEDRSNPGDVLIEYGKKYAGKKFKEFSHEQIKSYVDWMKSESKDQSDSGKKFIRDAEAYLSEDVPF